LFFYINLKPVRLATDAASTIRESGNSGKDSKMGAAIKNGTMARYMRGSVN